LGCNIPPTFALLTTRQIMVKEFQLDGLTGLLVILGVALLVQLFYYLYYFLRVSAFKLKPHPVNYPAVSVVICARNEEENLKQFLPRVLQQEYPDFEVIVVNDCSFDGTQDVLEEFSRHYPNLVLREIKEVEGREHGKKFALTIGIKAAKNEILLLTDADCFPTSADWITHAVNGYGAGKEIVLGYGKYSKKSGLLNQFIRFDAFFIAVQFLSKALAGSAYMGVGRNLSYSRSLFFKTRGFASHMHIWSGDDDLFINEVATANNVSVVIDKGAFTVSEPKTTWRTWFRQKKRHHSTARYYKSQHKMFLLLYPLSFYVFYIALILGAILFPGSWMIFAGVFVFRSIIQITVLQTAALKLDEKDLGWKSTFFEILQGFFIHPAYFFATLFVKQRTWS
jgi:biofilm PGA synthesis N-glycosyltransferase PgaC